MQINEIKEFAQLNSFMFDDDFEYMLTTLEKMFRKPDVPAEKIEELIVKLQALSGMMAVKALFYRTVGKDGVDERTRKDAYYTARELLDKLVDALKYVSKDKLAKMHRGM